MQVREGELVIVTGPSGSGKTTLLTILGTMRKPSEGKLQLLGADTTGLVGAELDALRNRIRFLFQKRNLLSSLTALQNVIAGVSTTRSPIPTGTSRAPDICSVFSAWATRATPGPTSSAAASSS